MARFILVAAVLAASSLGAFGQSTGSPTITCTGFGVGQGGVGTVTIKVTGLPFGSYDVSAILRDQNGVVVHSVGVSTIQLDAEGCASFTFHLQLAPGQYKIDAFVRDTGATGGTSDTKLLTVN